MNVSSPAPGALIDDDFLTLAGLVQTGIDGANIPLERLLNETTGRELRALEQVELKLAEAELWLGAVLEARAVKADL